MTMVLLMTNDGELHKYPFTVINESETIKNVLKSAEDKEEVIPLPIVNSEILIKIVDLLSILQQNEEQLSMIVQDLVVKEQEKAVQVINAIDYLECKLLLNKVCQKIANMIKNQTTEKIREIFQLPDTYDEEEKMDHE